MSSTKQLNLPSTFPSTISDNDLKNILAFERKLLDVIDVIDNKKITTELISQMKQNVKDVLKTELPTFKGTLTKDILDDINLKLKDYVEKRIQKVKNSVFNETDIINQNLKKKLTEFGALNSERIDKLSKGIDNILASMTQDFLELPSQNKKTIQQLHHLIQENKEFIDTVSKHIKTDNDIFKRAVSKQNIKNNAKNKEILDQYSSDISQIKDQVEGIRIRLNKIEKELPQFTTNITKLESLIDEFMDEFRDELGRLGLAQMDIKKNIIDEIKSENKQQLYELMDPIRQLFEQYDNRIKVIEEYITKP